MSTRLTELIGLLDSLPMVLMREPVISTRSVVWA